MGKHTKQQAAEQLREYRLRREQDMTVVMVSHDLGAALDQASHVLYLDHGHGFFGTREEFCTGHPEGRRAR